MPNDSSSRGDKKPRDASSQDPANDMFVRQNLILQELMTSRTQDARTQLNSAQQNNHASAGFMGLAQPGFSDHFSMGQSIFPSQEALDHSNTERSLGLGAPSQQDFMTFFQSISQQPVSQHRPSSVIQPTEALGHHNLQHSPFAAYGNDQNSLRPRVHSYPAPNDDMLSRMLSVRRAQGRYQPTLANATLNADGQSGENDLSRMSDERMNQIQKGGTSSTDSVPFAGFAVSALNHPNNSFFNIPSSSLHQPLSEQQVDSNQELGILQHIAGNLQCISNYATEMPQRIDTLEGDPEAGSATNDFAFSPHQLHLLEPRAIKKRSNDDDKKVEATTARKRKRRKSHRVKPQDMPRRPLSAYNLFFSAERRRILQEIEDGESGEAGNNTTSEVSKEEEKCPQALLRPIVSSKVKRRPHRKTHGKISFQCLAQMVGQRWKQLLPKQKKYYQDLADEDMLRHKQAMEVYYKSQSERPKEEGVEGENKADDTKVKKASCDTSEGGDSNG